MRCERCSNEYRTTVGDEKLIAAGDLAPLCPRCVSLAPFAPRRPRPEPVPERIGWDGTERLPGRIFRVETFVAEKRTGFMEIDRTPIHTVGNVTHEPRRTDIRVTPIKFRAGGFEARNELPAQIRTNLMGIFVSRRPLWFKKSPPFVDKFTGIASIELPFRDIASILFDPGAQPTSRFDLHDSYVRIGTKAGGEIRVSIERSPRHRSEARRLIVPVAAPGQID